MPEGRTHEYVEWRACERWGIRPPGMKASWDECSSEIQLMMIAYDDIRTHEEHQTTEVMIKAIAASRGAL